MHQQHRISPQQPALDRPTYRFKPSFSAFLSLIAAILTSTVFVVEIINPAKLSTTPIQNLPILITFVLLLIILISFLTAHLALKLSGDITIAPIGINGRNLLSTPTYICWQDISSVKIRYFFGVRDILIRSAIDKKRLIVLDSFSYNFPKILDRVSEYIGDDHPLTIALEKEISLPRQNPAKMLWRIIIGIIIILSIWLIGGNLYADYREKPLNEAIANYVRQHPKTPPNQAAIDLQASMAKLGVSLVAFSDGSKVPAKPEKIATEEWRAITPILDKYVTDRLNITEDSILPPPAKLHAYLNSHQADITAIQDRLLGSTLPNWGSDSAWVERSDLNAGDSRYVEWPNYLTVRLVSKLLIANIFDRQQAPDREILQQLKAIKNLSQSLQKQPILLGQLITRISERDINRLYRYFEFIPDGWIEDLAKSKRDEMMQTGIEHELLSQVRIIQDPKLLMMDSAVTENKHKSPFISLLKYYHIAQPYTRLIAVDYYEKSHQSLSFWSAQNICRTIGDSTKRERDNFLNIQEVSRQYIKVKTSDLDRELTSSVRQIKSHLRSGESIDRVANEFKLASQACPGEQWLAKGKDGSVAISLSHPPNWKALGMDEKLNLDRFTYKINTKNIKPVL
jgi:hypothetical protein